MFSSLHRPWIIGMVLLAVLALGILVKLLFFQNPQPSHPASAAGYSLQTVTYCSPNNIPQLMDIYSPATASSNAPMPLVEMVHGGGWTGGSRGDLKSIDPVPEVPAALLGLLADGFVVTSIDYRLAPQYKFPDNIEDVKCSIRFLRAHAVQYHINPGRIGLIGASAGGHLVSLAGLARSWVGWDIGEYTSWSSEVQAVVDMFGPEYIDSAIGDPAIGDPTIFGSDPRELQLASPPHYIIAAAPHTDPPFLILQGDQDGIVPPYHSLRFYNELLNAGQTAILQMVQNARHGFVSTGPIIPSAAQISTLIINFFLKYLTGRGPTALSAARLT